MPEIQNLFTVFGIARSGNHAIIDWLYTHLEKPKCFFNNIGDDSPIERRELYYVGDSKFFNIENIKKYYTDKYLNKEDAMRVFAKRLEEFTEENDWEVEKDLQLPRYCQNMIISKENFAFSQAAIEKLHAGEDTFSEKINRRFAIVMMRHPANLLASRLYLTEKRKRTNGPRISNVNVADIMALWKEYAALYLQGTQLTGYDQTLYITLEDWHRSPSYRQRLLESLGINTPESRTSAVGLYGGGSSFDGVVRSVQATGALPLHSRWLQLLENNDPAFANAKDMFASILTEHPEVLDIAEDVYGAGTSREIRDRLSGVQLS